MKKYLVDTNVILRLILNDNDNLYQQAKIFFQQAKNKKIQIVILPEIIFELDYVLRGLYKLSKNESAKILLEIVKTPYLKIENRDLFIESLEKYLQLNIDLFDIYLFLVAKKQSASLYSFDKDFKKIKL